MQAIFLTSASILQTQMRFGAKPLTVEGIQQALHTACIKHKDAENGFEGFQLRPQKQTTQNGQAYQLTCTVIQAPKGYWVTAANSRKPNPKSFWIPQKGKVIWVVQAGENVKLTDLNQLRPVLNCLKHGEVSDDIAIVDGEWKLYPRQRRKPMHRL